MSNVKVGVIGLAGSGKDTLASILRERSGGVWGIDRYAAPLKRATRTVFGPLFDARSRKEVAVPFNQDVALDAAFQMCRELRFNDDMLEEAGRYYTEELEFYQDELSPRRYQQLLGTQVARRVFQECFVTRLQSERNKRPVFVPDVRFKNELLAVNLLVVRPDVVQSLKRESLHESELFAWQLTETAVNNNGEPFSYSGKLIVPVYNDSTVEHLRTKKAPPVLEYLNSLE